MARHYLPKVHQGALDDPRVRIVIGDGLPYLQHSQECFDLIIFDLTDPQGLAAPLYQVESLRHCQRLLGEQGVLSLYLGSPLLQPQRCVELMQALHGARGGGAATPSRAPTPPPGVIAQRVAFGDGIEAARSEW